MEIFSIMETKNKTILDILLERNRISEAVAERFSKDLSNEQIEDKLKKEKLASSEDIAKAYAVLYNLSLVNLSSKDIAPEVYQLIPKELIEKYHLLVFSKEGKIPGAKLKIAIGSPANLNEDKEKVIDHLQKTKNITAELYITTPEDIEAVQKRLSGASSSVPPPPPPPAQPAQTVPEKPVEISKVQDLSYLENPLGAKTVDLKNIKIPYDIISKFPLEISQKYNMVVFENPAPNIIKVAVSDPYSKKVKEILDFVREKNEIAIEEYVASPSEIADSIKTYYKKPLVEQAPPAPQAAPMEKYTPPAPILTPKTEPAPAPPPIKTPLPTPPPQPKTTNLPQPPQMPVQMQPILRKPIIYQQPKPQEAKPQFVQEPTPTSEQEETIEEEFQRAPENDLDKFIGREVKDIEILKQIGQSGNVPQILAACLALAAFKKASDVHIEPEEKNVRVRFRIDGILRDVLILPKEMGPAIISRIKILSRLKIDEQRIPQDGRFDVLTHAHAIDLRVSTLPTVRGEKAAIRLLDKTQTIFNLTDLGFEGRNLKLVERNIIKPYGIILATGPTGSGKSTTLYAILQKINNPKINVITLEDPVEYELAGINQCQVKPKIGFSFAEGLRSVLRQDPNIIMVGEIRDAETAGMATHAALTGHLVLTTLHTNDSAGALPRLINMGIEPFLITSSINLIIAQRLVRKICQKCKQELHLPEELQAEINKELDKFNLEKPYKFYEAKGCDECDQGYSGRIGIYEVLEMNDKIEDLAVKRRPASEIAKSAQESGMITLKQDGLIKAVKGVTTVSEVLRVTSSD